MSMKVFVKFRQILDLRVEPFISRHPFSNCDSLLNDGESESRFLCKNQPQHNKQPTSHPASSTLQRSIVPSRLERCDTRPLGSCRLAKSTNSRSHSIPICL